MSEDSTPRHDIDELASSAAELYQMLMTGDGLPDLPFWLAVGDAGFKVTEQNRDALSLGMLLQMDAKEHFRK